MELFPPYNLHFISANGVGQYFVSGEVSLKISSCCDPPPRPGAESPRITSCDWPWKTRQDEVFRNPEDRQLDSFLIFMFYMDRPNWKGN